MTEATQQEQQREQQREQSPYTQFRDSFPLGEDSHNDPKMAVHWRDADRWRQTLRDQIADISSDPELSDEGEQSRMEATYSRLAPRIEQESKAAKQKAAKLAADAERRSIPVAFDAKAGDPQVHGNILAEAQEIRERVARIKEQTPKGMKAPRQGVGHAARRVRGSD
jgi:hypothetical protein